MLATPLADAAARNLERNDALLASVSSVKSSHIAISQSNKILTKTLTAVSANITNNRRMSSLHKKKAKHNDSSHVTHGRMELDSHADTIVLGSNAIIMQIHKSGM